MYKEIGKAKSLTLAGFNWNLVDYLYGMRNVRTSIHQKDSDAYTEDAFICDIFAQLKTAPVRSFCKQIRPSGDKLAHVG